jgi:hypothetical protein
VSGPRVDLYWWAECPSWERTLEMLRESMEAAGYDPDDVVVTEIETEEQARHLGFPGSPTIRVDGADIQDPGENPIGLSCRVYRHRDGRISPLPDPADIGEALARTMERR